MSMLLRTAKVADAPAIANVYLASRATFLAYAPLAHSDADVRWWIEAKLIPGALEHALAGITQPVRLYTFQANTGARRFYERHSFKACSSRTGSPMKKNAPMFCMSVQSIPPERLSSATGHQFE